MARYTERWGLSILGSGDSLQADGYKFTDADRHLIDRLLTYATEQHRHTGLIGYDPSPQLALALALQTTGGSLAAGARYYYRYTVIDAYGNESGGSPMGHIDTPTALVAPGAPALSYVTGSGNLLPGPYGYVLSAYVGASTRETKATNAALVTIPGALPNNEIALILPALPPGADGLNVYRKSPNGMHYLWITSIANPTAMQQWVDDGSIEGDCDRSLPGTNTAGGTNAVVVNLPADAPVVDGASWKVYRTVDPTYWGRSFLKTITPIGATPQTPRGFTDTGLATEVGGPPAKAQTISSPPKINLTDGAEVEGTLPPGRVVSPHMLAFVQPGTVTAKTGTFTWVCDFTMADIIAVRLYLGPGSAPAAQPVVADIVALRPSKGSAVWQSIFNTAPSIPVGQNATARLTPDRQHLERGDALSGNVVQAGGGATPTDSNLTISLLLYVKDGSETSSYVWTTT
jgi:hypothetical protein